MIEKKIRQRDTTEIFGRSPGQKGRSPGRAVPPRSGFVHLGTSEAIVHNVTLARIDLRPYVELYRMFRISLQSLQTTGAGTGGIYAQLSRDGANSLIGTLAYSWTRLVARPALGGAESDFEAQGAYLTGDIAPMAAGTNKCSGTLCLYQPSDVNLWPRFDWDFAFINPDNTETSVQGAGVLKQVGGMINGIGIKIVGVIPHALEGCWISVHGAR